MLTVLAEPVPLTIDADGVARVAATRVALATVIAAFHEGATAEMIVQQYPALGLGDVYAVIGYYLRHQAEVDTYLIQQRTEGESIRRENEARFHPDGVRARLIARRQA